MQPTFQPLQNTPRRRKVSLMVLGAIPVVLFLGVVAYNTLTFHVTKTDPSLSKVGNYSPFLRAYFNKPLDGKSLKVTDPQHIISNTTVGGKTITFSLKSGLAINNVYTIVVDRIASTSGDVIEHKILTFTVKNIPVSELSADQQAALVNKQDKFPYSVHSIPFKKFDELTNNGLTADQEQVVKKALFDYSTKAGIKFTSANLNTSSITQAPYDPNSATLARTLTFDVSANDTPYHLVVSYEDLTNATVLVYNQAGTVVFDNTTVTDTAPDSVEE